MAIDVAADFRMTLEDTAGFAKDITLTDPLGNTAELLGDCYDIGQAIDPGTGLLVSGRYVNVSISVAALREAGLELPEHEGDPKRAPWRFEIEHQGKRHVFTVLEANESKSMDFVNVKLKAFVE
ncbi:MAG TPA: hypothetical protein VGK73_38550 [Polyangiaceae bacterium]